jgi:hypothetical protein
MKPMTKRTLLLIVLTALTGAAAARLEAADRRPMTVTLSGSLRVEQNVPSPCDDVDQTTPVVAGLLQITPNGGLDVSGGKLFTLTRASVSFAPFTVSRSCLGHSETREYTEIHVDLGRAVTFTAPGSGTGPYAFTIPKDDFSFVEAALVNGDLETGIKKPEEDVTGTIDLGAGTVNLGVRVATKIHIEFGCVPVFGCVVNDDYHGHLTATLTGTIAFPPQPDADGDGVPDEVDNCPLVANPTQAPVATPVISAPADVTLASCLSTAIGTASAVEICEAGPVTVTNDAPSPFPRGSTVVTWRADDTHGRFATDTQTVTVVDTTGPTFVSVPGPISRNNCGPALLGFPDVEDDCGGRVKVWNDAPFWFPAGATTVTWKARDKKHNLSTASQVVTVTDTVEPALSCEEVDDPRGHHGHRGHRGHHHDHDDFFRVKSFDACAPPTLRLGSFVLSNHEVIQIVRSSHPGVRFDGWHHGVRRFKVGPGENVVTAVDPSSNVAEDTCR